MTHSLTIARIFTNFKRSFLTALICAAIALMLAAPFSPAFAAVTTDTQLLPPTVPGSATVCNTRSGNILAMIDAGTPGGASAISCIQNSVLTPTGNLTLSGTGNLTIAGDAVITGTATIQGQKADANTIITANALATMPICAPGQAVTKTAAGVFSCIPTLSTVSSDYSTSASQSNNVVDIGKHQICFLTFVLYGYGHCGHDCPFWAYLSGSASNDPNNGYVSPTAGGEWYLHVLANNTHEGVTAHAMCLD